MAQQILTIASILRGLADRYDGPVPERELMDRVLERRPSRAKDPYASIREKLRWDGLALGWLRLGNGMVLPRHAALQGTRFRCTPSPADVRAGTLATLDLSPFVLPSDPAVRIEDGDGWSVSFVGAAEHVPLRAWYEGNSFAPGDSILVTIMSARALTLRIEREPTTGFRTDLVATQDENLRTAIREHMRQFPTGQLSVSDVMLPVFAQAPWRHDYPGSPWRQAIQHDGHIQLVENALQWRGRILDRITNTELTQHDIAASLTQEVEKVQARLRLSRQRDAEAGLWDPWAAQAAQAQDDDDLAQGSIDPLIDSEWGQNWDDDDLQPDDEEGFIDLHEARQRLMAVLTPEEATRFQQAHADEAEQIIARHLTDLLVQDPSLFVTIAIPGVAGPFMGSVYLDTQAPLATDEESTDWEENTWSEEIDDDDWDFDDDEGQPEQLYGRSVALLRQFQDFMRENGKSDYTMRVRTRDVMLYADFLANMHNKTLDSGDYATLDEWLFFVYPSQSNHSSPRSIRELCTSLKQFYTFLRQRGVIPDDAFAQAIWQRREEAARVTELYNTISDQVHDTETLLRQLFDPYLG